jgi:hypothetical protein
LGVATPALADGAPNHHGNNTPAPAYQHNTPAPAYQENKFERDMNSWERGWSPVREDIRFTVRDTLTKIKLTRRLEAQGYYRVRNLTPGRFGNGWRAEAVYRGHRVVVRVDQFTGRVIAARYI